MTRGDVASQDICVTDRKKYLLRIDPDLWHDLQAWAAAELRSVNGQIEYLLRQAVQRRRKASDDEAEDRGATEQNR